MVANSRKIDFICFIRSLGGKVKLYYSINKVELQLGLPTGITTNFTPLQFL